MVRKESIYFIVALIVSSVVLFAFVVNAFAVEIPQMENEPYFNETVTELATGKFSIGFFDIIKKIYSIFFDEVLKSKEILVSMIMIGLASSISSLMQTAFETNGVGETAFYACFGVMCVSALECFYTAQKYASEVISLMNIFVTKLSPVISVTLIMSGKTASASAFHPILSSGAYVLALIAEKWILPLVTFQTVLAVVNNMSLEVHISGACKLLGSIIKWILTAAFTLFSGLCGLYGFGAPALDGVGAKTIKFAVGSFVPIVGGFLAETLDTVISGGTLMKNVVGGAGIAAICTMCAVPIIKISIMIFMMKITAAIIEPITDRRFSQLLWDVSSAVTMLFAMVVTIAVLFVICISIIVKAT